ncbi:hypothetical protein [Brevibacillus agri]|uniref:hypothetical protein n=1 Tax=Brevibacillus agri TaxID=51101 RepID=UPI0018CCA729|nr:hypothetical protein [Brevibacillus agri]
MRTYVHVNTKTAVSQIRAELLCAAVFASDDAAGRLYWGGFSSFLAGCLLPEQKSKCAALVRFVAWRKLGSSVLERLAV